MRLRLEPLEERIVPTATGLADSGLADSGYLKDEEDQVAPLPTVGVSRALRALLHAGQRQLLDQAVGQRTEVQKKLQVAQKNFDGAGRQYSRARDLHEGVCDELPPDVRLRQELLQRSAEMAEQVEQVRSEAADLGSRLAHLESTDAIHRWVKRYGEGSAQVQELKSSVRQQRSELQTAQARLRQLEEEHAELRFKISAIPEPPEATIAAVTRAEAELLSLQCETQRCRACLSDFKRRLEQADVRLTAAVRLASRQARLNVKRLREDHRKHFEAMGQAATKLVATIDQNSHVRLDLGSFGNWRSHQAMTHLPDSDGPASSQHRVATKLLQAIDRHLISELAAVPTNRHGRFVVDVHADLGVHFIVEAANALIDARDLFAARHDQFSQALGLSKAAGLST